MTDYDTDTVTEVSLGDLVEEIGAEPGLITGPLVDQAGMRCLMGVVYRVDLEGNSHRCFVDRLESSKFDRLFSLVSGTGYPTAIRFNEEFVGTPEERRDAVVRVLESRLD